MYTVLSEQDLADEVMTTPSNEESPRIIWPEGIVNVGPNATSVSVAKRERTLVVVVVVDS
jgi:hypothetical protein